LSRPRFLAPRQEIAAHLFWHKLGPPAQELLSDLKRDRQRPDLRSHPLLARNPPKILWRLLGIRRRCGPGTLSHQWPPRIVFVRAPLPRRRYLQSNLRDRLSRRHRHLL